MTNLDDAFARGFRLAWRYCPATTLIAVCLLLTGCGEPASCWNDIKGRFTACDEMRSDEINRELDKRDMKTQPQADCKSGAGCCRPRVQDGDPRIECSDEDWRK